VTGAVPSSGERNSAIAGALALVMAFYAWTATTSNYPLRPSKRSQFFYTHLANAFLAGQLHLLVLPRAELLALRDPYNPDQNAPYRLHDAALFEGKYYLYYGPTPALLLFAPFRALTNRNLSEPVAVALFCSVGLLFVFLLFRFLRQRYLPDTPGWMLLAAIPALGFGNVAPFLLRRPVQYEVAISAGYCLVFGSLYFVARGGLGDRVNRVSIALGSLLLGLAGGARFTALGAGLVLLLLAGLVTFRHRRHPTRDHFLSLLAFFGPVAACVALLGLYNYARFGSVTEFGMHYTLQGFQSAQEYAFYNLSRVPAGLFYYLLVPPRASAVFPFLHLDPGAYLRPPRGYYLEPVAGVFVHTPLLLILPLAPMLMRRLRGADAGLGLFTGGLLAVGLLFIGLFALAAGTMRYEVDFATFLLVPALLLWATLLRDVRHNRSERVLATAAFLVFLVITVLCNTAFSITGYYNNLKVGSPSTYEAIHNVFRPLERWLSSRER
jgi:hypothetical protein